jgi:hypothetical protein
MASFGFYAGEDFALHDATGSGLGFFGDGFGVSLGIGQYNSRTFITNSAGSSEGPEVDNIKYTASNSGIIGQAGSSVLLTQIPNYKATLNARFEHASAVKVTNTEFRIFDRNNINNPASGLTCRVAEIIHPDTSQTNNGSGDATWSTLGGSGTVLDLVDSPGVSGLSPSGANTTSTRHDWYLAISVSPDTVGAKTNFGAYIATEYL